MNELTSYDELRQVTKTESLVLIYVSTAGCSVCHADYPKVQAIVDALEVPAYELRADQVQEAVGQLSLFAAPVVLVFFEGREIHRQARIIDFRLLEKKLQQVQSAS